MGFHKMPFDFDNELLGWDRYVLREGSNSHAFWISESQQRGGTKLSTKRQTLAGSFRNFRTVLPTNST